MNLIKRVSLKILNQKGDTELMLEVDKAVDTIVDNLARNGRFAFIDQEVFNLDLKAIQGDEQVLAAESARLRALLSSKENPVVHLTDAVTGGN